MLEKLKKELEKILHIIEEILWNFGELLGMVREFYVEKAFRLVKKSP